MSESADEPIGVLCLDDGSQIHHSVKARLQSSGRFRPIEPDGADLDGSLRAADWRIILCGLTGPGLAELEILDRVRALGGPRPVVIVTSQGSEEWAVEAMRRGAADYISANATNFLDRLPDRLLAALQAWDAGNDGRVVRAEPDAQAAILAQYGRLVCVVGFDGYVRHWNPAWDSMLGFNRDEMTQLGVHELVHPDDVEKMRQAVTRMAQNEYAQNVEVRVRCKDGSFKWIVWNGAPCVSEQIYYVTGHEVTQGKLVEQQLRESQERLQLIATASNEAIWDWDLRTGRLWRNESYIQTFGGSEDASSIAEWFRERLHPADRERVMASICALATERRQWTMEFRLRRLDGTYAHVYDRGFVVFGPDDQPVRMVGSLLDISAQRKTEQRLHESDERFRLVTKATRELIWDWDFASGKVTRSDAFQQVFGYDPDSDGEDRDWWIERIHPEDRPRVMPCFEIREAANLQERACEFRLRRPDGSYAEVLCRGFVMVDSTGKRVRMIGSVVDVSERRRAEVVAHMHQFELAHSARVRTIGEIATGVAHELNQPLTAIANYAESCTQAIASRSLSHEKLLDWLEHIVDNTHRAAEMLRRLRGFARKGEPRRSTLAVDDVIQEVVDLLEAECRMQKISVHCESIEPKFTKADRIQIQQVLVNLLGNAFDAMADNPPEERQVTIGVGMIDDRIDVSVEDLGKGVSPLARDRVFEAFYTTKPSGVGIGLAISRSIIEDHGGRMWVDANRPRGAAFHFTLPLEGAHDVSVSDRVGCR